MHESRAPRKRGFARLIGGSKVRFESLYYAGSTSRGQVHVRTLPMQFRLSPAPASVYGTVSPRYPLNAHSGDVGWMGVIGKWNADGRMPSTCFVRDAGCKCSLYLSFWTVKSPWTTIVYYFHFEVVALDIFIEKNVGFLFDRGRDYWVEIIRQHKNICQVLCSSQKNLAISATHLVRNNHYNCGYQSFSLGASLRFSRRFSCRKHRIFSPVLLSNKS